MNPDPRLPGSARLEDSCGGVMFDFSGTLMRTESTSEWLRGVGASESQVLAWAGPLESVGAMPGGGAPAEVPAHLAQVWRDRDLTAEHHRACYTALARLVVPEALAEALYNRSCTPEAWRPYPDALPTLRELRRRGLRVAVVSNIGWDLRALLALHGLADFVDVFVLSYEVGIEKPDPRIFQLACDKLGLPPGEVLMVGDDRRADGGAAALGCPVYFVDHLPATARPDALRQILTWGI
ncbi:HAD-IA family hydrolase [Nonomuraea sp. NPDC050556]|uniref:HAD-IA family hydrolase n=1 Tax=Nonomuraea sp. NPDC050556 TaxID=3364369 RepID=UPI0037B529A4